MQHGTTTAFFFSSVALAFPLYFGFAFYFGFGQLGFLGVSCGFWVCGFFWKGCSGFLVGLGGLLGWGAFEVDLGV